MDKKTHNNLKMTKKSTLMNIFIATLLSFLLLACGGDSTSPPPPPESNAPPECAGGALGDDYTCITLNNRDSILYQPNEQENEGIAIFLHGSPGYAEKVMGIFDAKMIAEKYNLITLSPEGTTSTWGWLSKNSSQESGNKDIEYIEELLIKIRGDYNVTSNKLYIFGYSAGGFMAYKLACNMPEQITAIISLAGQYRGDLDACTNSTPVNLHHFHSKTDKEVPFRGRSFSSILSVEETIAHWQQKNGCDVDFDTIEHPGVTSTSSGTVTERYQDCDKSVVLSKMTSVAHESNYLPDRLLEIYGYLFTVD